MVAINTNSIRPGVLDRAQLELIQTPSPTLSWSPIPHHRLFNKVEERIQQHGLQIQKASHTVTHDDNRYFGTIELAPEGNREYRRMVGIRNSHDKSFSASIIAGARVIVCSNGMFVGEELCLARKHTSRVHEDLDNRLDESFTRLLQEWYVNDQRIQLYRERKITDKDAHDLVILAVDSGALPASSIPKVLHEYREPFLPDFHPRNVWSLHNAFTEVMKGKPLLVPERSRHLQRCFDTALGIN
jgi:hypothetical protein